MRPGCQCSKAEEINKSDIDMTERKKHCKLGRPLGHMIHKKIALSTVKNGYIIDSDIKVIAIPTKISSYRELDKNILKFI